MSDLEKPDVIITQESKKPAVFECPDCNLEFQTKSTLHEHVLLFLDRNVVVVLILS